MAMMTTQWCQSDVMSMSCWRKRQWCGHHHDGIMHIMAHFVKRHQYWERVIVRNPLCSLVWFPCNTLSPTICSSIKASESVSTTTIRSSQHKSNLNSLSTTTTIYASLSLFPHLYHLLSISSQNPSLPEHRNESDSIRSKRQHRSWDSEKSLIPRRYSYRRCPTRWLFEASKRTNNPLNRHLRPL